MKERLKQFNNKNLVLSLVLIVTGAVLLIWPQLVLDLAVTITGIALIVLGIGLGISWYRGGMVGGKGYVTLAESLLAVLAGIVMLAARDTVIKLFPIVDRKAHV